MQLRVNTLTRSITYEDGCEYVIEDCGAVSVWNDNKRICTFAPKQWINVTYLQDEESKS